MGVQPAPCTRPWSEPPKGTDPGPTLRVEGAPPRGLQVREEVGVESIAMRAMPRMSASAGAGEIPHAERRPSGETPLDLGGSPLDAFDQRRGPPAGGLSGAYPDESFASVGEGRAAEEVPTSRCAAGLGVRHTGHPCAASKEERAAEQDPVDRRAPHRSECSPWPIPDARGTPGCYTVAQCGRRGPGSARPRPSRE